MAAGDVDVSVTSINAKKCAFFDGTNDEITIADHSDFDLNNFSFGCWLKLDGANSTKDVIQKNNDGEWFRLDINGTKYYPQFVLSDGTTKGGNSTTATDPGTWVHVAFTRDEVGGKLYINGVEDATSYAQASALALKDTGDSIHIGYRDGTGGFLKGQIADMQMHTRALTNAEIIRMMNGEKLLEDMLFRLAFLNDDYTDSSNNSHDATNVGTRIGISDDTVEANIKAKRTDSADNYFLISTQSNQVMDVFIDEA